CPLQDGDCIRVGRHLFRFLTGASVETQYHEEIARLATTDALTGLPNRRALIDFLSQELARAARHSRPMSLVMLDIDHFKAANDCRGHLAGDFALRELADTLRGAVGSDDLLTRYGGGTFALALPDCDGDNAASRADRLRLLVRSTSFSFGNQSFSLT